MIQLRQPKFTHLRDFTGTGLTSYIYRNKEFKISTIPGKVFDHLTDIKEYLGLFKEDTVYDYCKREDAKLYAKQYTSTYAPHKHSLIYDYKNGIGV